MADAADPTDTGKPSADKLSLETRVALIGVIGALTGTLIGGLVTWLVTQDQLSSQKAEARRAERLEAYSKYFGNASRLWLEVQSEYDSAVSSYEKRQIASSGGKSPKLQLVLDSASRVELATLENALEQEYALIALIAPDRVRAAAFNLNRADTAVWSALESEPINTALYARELRLAALGKNPLLMQFSTEAKKDLGTPPS